MENLEETNTTVTSIEKSAVSEDRFVQKQDDMVLARLIQRMNNMYAFTLYGNSAIILKTDEEEIKFLPETTFLSLVRNQWYYSKKDEKNKQIGPTWLCSEERRSYSDVVFYPGTLEDKKIFNLWRGFSYRPLQGDCSLFLDHIRANICAGNEKNYEWLLDWMADAVQKPFRKNWTAVLMESKEEGTGKGFFAGHFGKLFGRHYAAYNKPKQLLGQFNSHLEDKLIVFLDEGSLIEKNAYDYAKSLITEPTLNIEPKGRSMREVKSYHRIIMASNDRHILRSSIYDRRWMVLRVAPNSVNNLNYFKAIETQLESGGYEALMYMLVNRKYDENSVKTIVKTDALTYQKEQNLPEFLQWWRGCLLSGVIGDAATDWPPFILPSELYASYINWCERMKVNKRESCDWLPRRLNEESGMSFRRVTLHSQRVYELPELDECRRLFDEKLGYQTDWEE